MRKWQSAHTPLILWHHSGPGMYDSGCCSVRDYARSDERWWKIIDIIATKNYIRINANSLKCCQRVIRVTVIISVKKLLEPLEEFKIILETTLDKFIHRNDLYDSIVKYLNQKEVERFFF